MKNQTDETEAKLAVSRFRLECSYEEFLRLLGQAARHILLQMGNRREFVIDNFNEPTIRQLHLYLSRNPDFSGDLDKGVMLQGKYGSGKTILMRSYAHIQNYIITRLELRYPLVSFATSMDIVGTIKQDGVKQFARRELIIDEFGREPKAVMDFGNTIRPLAELISLRAETGAITHATSNFSLETLSGDDFYGKMIGDRLRAMFNFIVVDGDSRRA
ncbi:hypothetical protein BN938_1688 [Mucinivorans hirudinis]|uniref:ATPase n=1 Tax=Mucinivorans hirudinis TaxID=1433126 RepID=A0A060RCY8_9BACT|nr:hypothetical protein BN938_1688 [Mucinivorans hirudinis]